MSLFDKIFGKAPQPSPKTYGGEFKLLNYYTPHFTKWGGSVYEQELVRAAIHARATHISKLQIDITGAAKPKLQTKLRHGPNEFQSWSQFLYRLSTILDVHNNAFIVPVFDEFGEISGVFPVLPDRCSLVQYAGVPYLRYEFGWGEKAAVELINCGVMTKFQYRNDIFGESNHALVPTMELIHMQKQAIEEGVKSAATYRFMAQLSNFAKAEDLAKERKRFTEENFSREAEGGGMLLFPNTYQNIQQIKADPFVVSPDQMSMVKSNVFDYFGVNEDVLTNKAYGDAWAAFYEGAIEPFAIQFSEVMTKMLFTYRERTQGNAVMATSNRIQYMTSREKLNYVVQLLDRGVISLNDARDVWNMPHVEGGDVRIIRGEYYNADQKVTDNEWIGDDDNAEQ